MADIELIKPRELPEQANVQATDALMVDNGTVVGKATPEKIVNAGAPVASEAEALAGVNNTKRMTPLRVRQVLDNVNNPAVLRAQAWAESSTPPDPLLPDSKSAKTWASIAEQGVVMVQWSMIAADGQTVLGNDITTGDPIRAFGGVAQISVNGFGPITPEEYSVDSDGVISLTAPLAEGDVVSGFTQPRLSNSEAQAVVQGVLQQTGADVAAAQEAEIAAVEAAGLARGYAESIDPDVLTRFIQGGTGAKARTLQEKGREIISIRDFGAIGDGILHPLYEGYSTLSAAQAVYPFALSLDESVDRCATQAAFDYAQGYMGLAPRAVSFGQGGFVMDKTTAMPEGIEYYGDFHIETTARTSTLFLQAPGCGDVFRVIPHVDTANMRRFWYGSFKRAAFRAMSGSTSGWGISFRDIDGNKVCPQDSTVLEDISTREMPSGGVEFPDGALPLYCVRHKHLFNGGPGIYITGEFVTSQGIHLLDISGDGNVGGAIKLEGLDANGSVLITNIKSEERVNPITGQGEQQNAIVIKDCAAGSVITVNGGTHISSVPDGSVNKKPGDFIKIEGSNLPHVDWTGLQIRVRPTDTGVDPCIIKGDAVGVSIPMGSKTGTLSNSNRIDRCVTNTAKRVFGTVDNYQGASAENVADQIAGTTPGRSLHETDTSNTAAEILSGGNVTRRMNGTIYETDVGTSGAVVRKEFSVPIRPQVLTKSTLPPASAQVNTLIAVSDPASGKGRLIYSDGSIWRYVSDDSSVS